MKRKIALQVAAISILTILGCAKPKVWVPPRIDLHQYGTLGLISFRSPLGYGPMASQQFLAALHSCQAGVPVLELGSLTEILQAVGHEAIGPDAVRAIGEKYRVDALVLGDLGIDNLRPNLSIKSLTEATASAEIQGRLNTRILDARSGATIWSDEARGTRTVAHLDIVAGRRPGVGAVDPEGEQALLVSWLVGQVTHDFRGRWARQ